MTKELDFKGSESRGVSRKSSGAKRVIALSALTFLFFVMLAPFPGSCQDIMPLLKPDVPKLDTAPPPKKLLGGVQHHERTNAEAKKPIFGKALGSGGNLKGGKAKLDENKQLRADTKNNKFDLATATIPPGIGIIGVKFLSVYGRPPVINRVFPGTPAFNNGLRANDVIMAVDGIPTFGLSKEEVYDMIVGTPNTPVTISLQRNGDFQVRKMLRMDFNDIPDPAVRRDYLTSR